MTDFSLDDVLKASDRICKPGLIAESPLKAAPDLARLAGFASLSVKDETTHPVGVFKLRGALNHFLQLSDEQKRRGVFAVSSGNHAQAVAFAAQQFRVAATILMPEDAPQLKLSRTRGYGAKVITYDRSKEDREGLAQKLADEQGLHLIHPYNDHRTMAGQGTMGVEIHRQLGATDIAPDAILMPCSGGGLASGIAVTRDMYKTAPMIFTAEPQGFDDTKRSLETGVVAKNPAQTGSVCDALLSPSPGSLTFPVLQRQKARGLAATDEDAFAAMFLASHFLDGLKLEPSGALALACALKHRDRFQGQNIVVVASGANVDPQAYTRMFAQGRAKASSLLPGFTL